MRPVRLRVIEEPGAKLEGPPEPVWSRYPIHLIRRAEQSKKVANSACFADAVEIEARSAFEASPAVSGSWPFLRPCALDARTV
jgi:hypothetical protein